MKIVEKIETLGNKLLFKLADLFILCYQKFAPPKLKELVTKVHQWILLKKAQFLAWKERKTELLKEKVTKLVAAIKEGKALNQVKEKVSHVVTKLKGLNPKTFKELIVSKTRQVYQFIKGQLARVPYSQIAKVSLIVFFFASGAGFIAYKMNYLAFESGFRKIASIPSDPVAVRPAYYKLSERQFDIPQLILPIFIEGTGSLKSLKIDITIEGTNRSTILYVRENEHAIRDYLNSRIEAFIPTFPLEAEGRGILKDKILTELNLLLKDEEVEGEVTQVHLKDILGG